MSHNILDGKFGNLVDLLRNRQEQHSNQQTQNNTSNIDFLDLFPLALLAAQFWPHFIPQTIQPACPPLSDDSAFLR